MRLEIMGINTKTYLVLPKILAALVMIPLLVCIATATWDLGWKAGRVLSGIIVG